MPAFSRRALLAALPASAALPSSSLARQDAGAIPLSVSFSGSRMLTSVTLGGRGPYSFVIDTGAQGSGIREDLATELHLKTLREMRLGGGGGPDNYMTYEAADVVLGGALRQPSMVFFGLKSRSTSLGGDGLLAGMMVTVDTTLDPRAGRLTLYPKGGADRAGFERLASDIKLGPSGQGAPMIYADVELDGLVRRMLVDTGSPWALNLSGHVVAGSGLWNDTRPYAPTVMKGIGGFKRLHGRTVRADRIRFGPLTLERPLVVLNDPGMGRAPFDGLIGLALVQQLALSTDIAGRALYARPGGLPPPPEHYNRSGLWLDEDGGRVSVTDVSPGSPAAEAGIRVGDRLKAGARIGEIARNFTAPAGQTVTIELERGSVPLTLKDYL